MFCFKKYIWFISLGYGFSVCAIGLTLTAAYFGRLFSFENSGILLTLILITVYGARLGGYLLYRERKSSAYNAKMKKEIKSGKEMKFFCQVLYMGIGSASLRMSDMPFAVQA